MGAGEMARWLRVLTEQPSHEDVSLDASTCVTRLTWSCCEPANPALWGGEGVKRREDCWYLLTVTLGWEGISSRFRKRPCLKGIRLEDT